MSGKRPEGVGDWRARSTARARVYYAGGVWAFQVLDSTGKVVDADNSVDWLQVLEQALTVVRAVRTVENIGHQLVRSYPELVEAVEF